MPRRLNQLIRGRRLSFRLIQLAALPFESLEGNLRADMPGTAAGILILRAMKAEQSGRLLGHELWDEALMSRASSKIVEAVLRYILSAGDIDRAAFDLRVGALSIDAIKNTAMTLAQQFRQEGRQEGQILAQQGAVIEALEIRFKQVPDTTRAAIGRIADAPRLHLLLGEAIRCADLESFSRALATE